MLQGLLSGGAGPAVALLLGCILCGKDAANPSTDSGAKPGRFLSSGGTKNVFEYGSKKVIAFITKGDPAESIKNELRTTEVLRKLGFETQNGEQICHARKDGGKEEALVMDSWEYLASVGMQVRDPKNGESRYGHSMIFGTMENINKERAASIMERLGDEAVRLMTNGMLFGGDVYGIVIKDTDETAEHDRNVPELFDVRRQEIKLFLSDLAIPGWDDWVKSNYNSMFDQETKMPSREKIKKQAYWMYISYESALRCAITNEEMEIIILHREGSSRKDVISRLYDVFWNIRDGMLDDIVDRVYAGLEGKYEEKCK